MKTYSLKRRNMPSARVIASRLIALVAVPLALTSLFLGYLPKPGYAGFLDNGGYALTISQYLMLANGPWGFWFGPSMLLIELIYAVFPDAIGAWKASIFFYQYASFLSAYAATRILKGTISREDHRWLEPALYAISLAYSFNVWIIGVSITTSFLSSRCRRSWPPSSAPTFWHSFSTRSSRPVGR
ncbi:MAG: hypothetical protein RXS42_07765 [Nitrososphaeria archaeon]